MAKIWAKQASRRASRAAGRASKRGRSLSDRRPSRVRDTRPGAGRPARLGVSLAAVATARRSGRALSSASDSRSALAVFVVACLGVLPLAGYMGEATEHLAHRTGPMIGGLLNATFGNAAELIISIVALQAGLVELVKASITGSILGNLLLILGLSLVAGGLKRSELRFNRTNAGMSAGMLALAVVALVLPALFHALHPGGRRQALRASHVGGGRGDPAGHLRPVAAVHPEDPSLSVLAPRATHWKARSGGWEGHPDSGPGHGRGGRRVRAAGPRRHRGRPRPWASPRRSSGSS